MRISFDCEQCGTNYKVEAARAGQSAKCRHCGATIRVPVPAPPPEVSESGAPILRHAERTKPFELAIGDGEHIEAIVAHVERYIGEVAMVFHETISDLIHVDVHHILPGPDRDFHTLFTTGMSDKPMTVPEGAEDFRFAELIACLPASWKLTQKDFADEANYWPIRLMKELARLPHEYETWLGPGHSVPNGEQPQPYAPNTKFSCALIVPAFQFGKEFWQAKMPDGRTINFYSIWPLLPDETEFKLREGYDALMDRLLQQGVTDVINIGRRSAVARLRWPFGR